MTPKSRLTCKFSETIKLEGMLCILIRGQNVCHLLWIVCSRALCIFTRHMHMNPYNFPLREFHCPLFVLIEAISHQQVCNDLKKQMPQATSTLVCYCTTILKTRKKKLQRVTKPERMFGSLICNKDYTNDQMQSIFSNTGLI